MIIRCTQKLLKELNQLPIEKVINIDDYWSWHANMFLVERRKCVLITHDSTLFSVFIPFLKKTDFENFKIVLGQLIFKNLLYEEIPQNQFEIVLGEHEEASFTKTNNRSVLGSMNDLKFQIEHCIYFSGGLNFTDIYELNQNLNRIPFSAIGYKQPIKMLKNKLEQLSP